MGTLQLGCHTFQCYLQATGRLTRSHHVHHDPREYLRVLCHGVCQGLALFHADTDFLQCILQSLVLCLFAEHFQGFEDADARLGHADELAAHDA